MTDEEITLATFVPPRAGLGEASPEEIDTLMREHGLSRGGGMADAVDSNSTVGNDVRVRVPAPAPTVAANAFMCRCNPESTAEADAVQAEARRLLAHPRHPTTDGNLLSKVVYGLTGHLFEAYAIIEQIDCDQWAAVSAVGWKDGTKAVDPDSFRTWIQCDEVEDGIAATYLAMAQHFGLTQDHRAGVGEHGTASDASCSEQELRPGSSSPATP